jgi:Polyketide cyclase / dehydrase and lipid transport
MSPTISDVVRVQASTTHEVGEAVLELVERRGRGERVSELVRSASGLTPRPDRPTRKESGTMGTFHLEVTIDRPRDAVFAVIADPTTMPRWYEAVQQATRTSTGPVTAGATYVISRSLPGGEVHSRDHRVRREPPRHPREPRRPHPVPVPLHPAFGPANDWDHPRWPHQRCRSPSAVGRR